MEYDIEAAIPHREPFLLLDRVTRVSVDEVRAEVTLRPEQPLWAGIYAGHYPGNPITPGVLLLEMIFQAAAVMVHEMAGGESPAGMPVVTRIGAVKFRTIVPPGATLEIRASLKERLANAFFMKGSVWLEGRAAVQAEFAVALADPETAR